jgi:glycosyltransferase involved in cell wall biosynthesis
MKILQVIPVFCFPELFGGSQMVLYQISKALIARGHEVTVYTSNLHNLQGTLNQGRESIDGIDVFRFDNINTRFSAKTGFVITPGMARAIKQNAQNFDLVHIHEARSFQHILVHRYLTKLNVPYVVQAHGSLGTQPKTVAEKAFRSLYDSIIGSGIYRSAAKALSLSDAETKQYARMGVPSQRIQRIENGIDLLEYSNLPEKGMLRKAYGIKSDQRIILYLGRISESKGLALLVDAFRKLIDMMDDVVLVIAGPDDGFMRLYKELITETGLEKNTIITGPLYGRQKLEAFVDSDIFVLPSIYETFPLTVIEAMACRKPVVITDCCALASVVNGRSGYAVHDSIEMRNAFIDILGNDKKRVEFGTRGRTLVTERYNWSIIVNQLEEIYRECVQEFTNTSSHPTQHGTRK